MLGWCAAPKYPTGRRVGPWHPEQPPVIVPPGLARWSLTQVRIGYAREDRGVQPWLQSYAMDGYAYAAQPG